MSDRVLLVGKRAAVLTRLRTALVRIGVDAEIVRDVESIGNGENDGNQSDGYRAVAFGRAVPPADRERMTEALRAANPDLTVVDGLAPITPLLVAQIEEALDRRPLGQHRVAEWEVTDGRLRVELRHRAYLNVTAHTLSRLHRAGTRELLDESRPAGSTWVDLPPGMGRDRSARAAFLVVRADQGEVRVLRLAFD